MKFFLITCALVFSSNLLLGQSEYPTLEQIEEELKSLQALHPDLVSIESIAESPGGQNVWLIRIGKGDEDLTPGLMFVGSVDGRHPAGSVMNLKLMERILENRNSLLDNFYFYFVPVLSPDAYVQYHADLIYERLGNARETDIDRDGRISEDPYDDLDGDGLITMVRIEDPTGRFTAHPSDNRIMIEFEERSDHEMIYRLISEGIDNDKDGLFNEDGPGGVNLNKNFSFDYPAFQPGAGEHAVSEEENRNLAEFLFERWNIYAVFTFGLENNLSHPVEFDRSKVDQRVIKGPLEKDASVNQKVSRLFKDNALLQDAEKMEQGSGSFSSWAYFHYCRFSFVSPAWLAPVVESDRDTEGKSDSLSGNYDLRYIHWAESQGISDYFVDWTEIDHPDFPGRKAEVGGFKPFVRYNPPLKYLEQEADDYFTFIQSVCEKMPRLEFQDISVEKAGDGVFRIKGRVMNSGQLPTGTELGDRSRWVRDIRHRILLSGEQELLLGHYRDFHKSLQAGEYFEFSWLVSGSGRVTLDAASPMTGLTTRVIELK